MRWFVIFSLLTACPKAPLEPVLPSGETGVIWVTRTPSGSGGHVEAPQVLFDGLVNVLAAEGLLVKPVALESVGTALVTARTDEERFRAVLGERAAVGLVVLVETRARFYSQIEGRYRWVVDVRAGVAQASDPAVAVVEVFEVPVFLQFEHESEADAVAAAEPVIRRHLARLLRRHLGAEPARW